MIANDQHESGPSSSGQVTTQQVDLSVFDGQRIAVLLDYSTRRIVLRGTAHFMRDDTQGNVLNIVPHSDEPGHPVLIISEADWNGRIIPDFHYGCRYCFIIGRTIGFYVSILPHAAQDPSAHAKTRIIFASRYWA